MGVRRNRQSLEGILQPPKDRHSEQGSVGFPSRYTIYSVPYGTTIFLQRTARNCHDIGKLAF